MKKRLAAILLAAVMVCMCALTGCAGENQATSGQTQEGGETSKTEEAGADKEETDKCCSANYLHLDSLH